MIKLLDHYDKVANNHPILHSWSESSYFINSDNNDTLILVGKVGGQISLVLITHSPI